MERTEHRRSNRVRSFLRGEVVHSNGSSRTECTIRDISETGARIEAPPSVTIPEFFELVIPLRNSRHRAQMIWRHGIEIGVAFLAEATPPRGQREDDSELRMRMRELEAETARIRAQLAEMRAAIEALARERKTA